MAKSQENKRRPSRYSGSNPLCEVESAWNEETRTLKQTVRIYYSPAVRYNHRAERPSKPKIFTPEEIQALMENNKSAGGLDAAVSM